MTYIEQKPDGYNLGAFHGSQHERQRILDLIETYKNKPDFTLDNLISLIRKDRDE